MNRKKTILTCFLLCFFIIGVTNLTSAPNSLDPAEEEAGYALLDSLVVTFKELAEHRESVIERTEKALVSMMKRIKPKPRDRLILFFSNGSTGS